MTYNKSHSDNVSMYRLQLPNIPMTSSASQGLLKLGTVFSTLCGVALPTGLLLKDTSPWRLLALGSKAVYMVGVRRSVATSSRQILSI